MNPDALFWKVINGELPLPQAAKTLGWSFVRYDEKEKVAHIEYNTSGAFTNPMGNIQGGILSAMLDDCMGPAVYVNIPPSKFAVTIESKTLFLSPASPGKIIGTGKIEHMKGSMCFTSGQLLDERGKILATSTAIFKISQLRWLGITIPHPIAKGMVQWKVTKGLRSSSSS
jgi:uncharacterized protein (TIGR00369 family)